MKVDRLFEQQFEVPIKFRETRHWIRLDPDSLPQIVTIDPYIDENNQFIPQMVVLTIDQNAPLILDRVAAYKLLNATNSVPLEKLLHWKHKIKH